MSFPIRVQIPHIYSWHLTTLGSCYCKKQIDVSFSGVCPLIEDKFHHNIVKVYCRTTWLRLVVPQPLWQCHDTISLVWNMLRLVCHDPSGVNGLIFICSIRIFFGLKISHVSNKLLRPECLLGNQNQDLYIPYMCCTSSNL